MRKYINILSIGLLSIIIPGFSFAQDTLSVEQAIQIGMERNYAIRISINEAEISSNNNSLGNSGFLPTLSADGGINKRVQNNVISYSDDVNIPDRNDEGAKTTLYNYGISANWTVFDGLTMFATSDRLSFEADISELEAQIMIEQTLADIISTYFQVVGLQKANLVLENTLEVSQERIRIAETKLDLGSGSEYDLLQAKADYNADRASLIRSATGLKQAKIFVNQILADTLSPSFNVQSDIELTGKLNLNQLLEESTVQNSELRVAILNENVARTEIREITGEWFPQIDLGAGYAYNRTESNIGFSDFSETNGFNYGVTARINLFDGLNKNRRRQNAQIELKNERLRLQNLELQIFSQIQQIYVQYEDALELIKLEQENLQYNQQSLDIALERFRLGTINSLELREAQLSLLNAENRMISAQIEAKAAETELLRISGRLLKKQ